MQDCSRSRSDNANPVDLVVISLGGASESHSDHSFLLERGSPYLRKLDGCFWSAAGFRLHFNSLVERLELCWGALSNCSCPACVLIMLVVVDGIRMQYFPTSQTLTWLTMKELHDSVRRSWTLPYQLIVRTWVVTDQKKKNHLTFKS